MSLFESTPAAVRQAINDFRDEVIPRLAKLETGQETLRADMNGRIGRLEQEQAREEGRAEIAAIKRRRVEIVLGTGTAALVGGGVVAVLQHVGVL